MHIQVEKSFQTPWKSELKSSNDIIKHLGENVFLFQKTCSCNQTDANAFLLCFWLTLKNGQTQCLRPPWMSSLSGWSIEFWPQQSGITAFWTQFAGTECQGGRCRSWGLCALKPLWLTSVALHEDWNYSSLRSLPRLSPVQAAGRITFLFSHRSTQNKFSVKGLTPPRPPSNGWFPHLEQTKVVGSHPRNSKLDSAPLSTHCTIAEVGKLNLVRLFKSTREVRQHTRDMYMALGITQHPAS